METQKNTIVAHLTAYFRSIGLVSLVIGGASMMQGPDNFWISVGLIYLGLVLLAIDGFCEAWPKKWVKWIFSGAILVVIFVFSWGWVFVDAPLPVTGMVTNAEYPEGTVLAGINWNPKFTELNIDLHNTTKYVYEDLNILIKPNYPVAAIAQASTWSGVSFEDRLGASMHLIEIQGARRTAHPLVLVATNAGYIVRCEKLPGTATLKIVMAIVEIKDDHHPHPPLQPGESMVRKEDLLRTNYSDGSTYWYGQKDMDHYTQRVSPNTVEVSGEYVAAQRRRKISLDLKVG